MYILNTKYDEKKTIQALDILYSDRKNQFEELAKALLDDKALKVVPHWKEFVLNFSLSVEDMFLAWSGQKSLEVNSPQKTLMILRKLGNGKISMNQILHLANMAYDLSLEFKEIYKRLL